MILLFNAARTGDYDKCVRLIDTTGTDGGVNINEKDYKGDSPIIIASQNGHVDIVDLLLSKGANANDEDVNGKSSVIYASESGHVNVVELLLSKGASIHKRDNDDGLSSIISASYYGHVNVVELLLSKGANIHDKIINDNNSEDDGFNSLMCASFRGHADIVKLLLINGADIHDKDIEGRTCFSLTRSDTIRQLLQKWPITMAIIALKELGLYDQIDKFSIMDIYQFLGWSEQDFGSIDKANF